MSRISNGSCDESCQEPNFHNKRFAWRGLGRDLLLSMRRPGTAQNVGEGQGQYLGGAPTPLGGRGVGGSECPLCQPAAAAESALVSLLVVSRSNLRPHEELDHLQSNSLPPCGIPLSSLLINIREPARLLTSTFSHPGSPDCPVSAETALLVRISCVLCSSLFHRTAAGTEQCIGNLNFQPLTYPTTPPRTSKDGGG